MGLGQTRGWWLGLLLGVALAACPRTSPGAPEEPAPAGFAWENLKEIRGWLPKPEKWFFRREAQPTGWKYYFAPQPFKADGEPEKGLIIEVLTNVRNQMEKSADEYAAATLAAVGTRAKVLTGWTRKGEPPGPFTTYALVCLTNELGNGGQLYMVSIVCVANHETDTLYAFILASPRAEWNEVEQWGNTMIANLHLDPKF